MTDGVLHGAADRVLPRRRRVTQQLKQIRAGQFLAQLLQADQQRVELALLPRRPRKLQYVKAPIELGQLLPAVVGLGVKIHNQ